MPIWYLIFFGYSFPDKVSLNLLSNLPEDAILIEEITGFSKGKENDIGSIILEKVEGCDLNEDQKEELLNLVSLYQDMGIEGLPQTPLLEFRVELNDYSPLIQNPYVVGPVLEEIMKRLIQQYVDAGFYIRGTSQYVSPAFVVVKPKQSDDTQLEKLKEYFTRNFIQCKERSMDDVIQELEDHFTFRLVVDFRKLNKRVIPDPDPILRAKVLNRIAKKKVYNTSS